MQVSRFAQVLAVKSVLLVEAVQLAVWVKAAGSVELVEVAWSCGIVGGGRMATVLSPV